MGALAFTLQQSRRAVSRQQTANQRTTLMTALRLRSGELCCSGGGLPRQLLLRCSNSCIHASRRGESTLQDSGV